MRMTYSTSADRAKAAGETRKTGRRSIEMVALACTSIVSLVGLLLVFNAKTAGVADVARHITDHQVVDLGRAQGAAELLPALQFIPDAGQRRVIAERLYESVSSADSGGTRRAPDSVASALGRATVPAQEIARDRRLAFLKDRLKAPAANGREAAAGAERSVRLLTAAQVADLKPAFVVRSPADYRTSFAVAVVLFLVAFWLAHLFAAVRGRRSDALLLPIVQLLCALGFIAMVSLRDPLRDAMLFSRFAQGTAIGCVLMTAASAIDYQRSTLRKLSYVPLATAFALSALLILFGSGPGASDAKVNLFGAQPVEAIRLLILLFLAGYFANRWEGLRELKEERPPHPLLASFDIPRLEYVLPVVVGIGLVLVFFFLQKDLGPAQVLSCIFLSLYGVARRRLTLVAAGLLLLGGGFAAGYLLDFPHTVVQRVAMWQSPWDNPVRGGDQVSHAIWALATGGWSGSGIGLGEPHFVPAAHTDMVLAVLGEELGFAGLLAVFGLYGLFAWRCLRIALGAPGDYTFFLALGITLSFVLELFLMAGGLLGLMPLTGVVTPFLSYGRSSMLANFAALGALLSISERSTPTAKAEFRVPVKALVGITAVLGAVVILRLGLVQVVRADEYVSAANLTVQADGMRRFEYNPRLLAVARQIVRGTICDRNGIPIAASRPADLEKHHDDLQKLGVDLAGQCPRPDMRCYPFGGLTFHLLGDWNSKVNWAASNTSFEERDDDRVLRGYDDHARVVNVTDPRTGDSAHVIRRDYRELLPLVRHRYQPDHPAVKRLLETSRDIRMSIDVRLQMRVAELLKKRLDAAGKQFGAALVLSDSGDVLASVSYPWPVSPSATSGGEDSERVADDTDESLLDRARYGLYPPGSSFKLVTAAAALRKDPSLEHATFTCERLPDGRVGARIRGWARPVRDDVQDRNPHGTLDMPRALVVSCNAYFAQLGLRLGAQPLIDTAHLFEISLGQPESLNQVRDLLPFTAYGQGQALASPFKMARVAATVAAGGSMPYGRWVLDDNNRRTDAPRPILAPPLAQLLSRTMRDVVLSGTGRSLRDIQPAIAGKTGTAEVKDEASHSWFVGFAPYDAPAGKRIAFAVVVEHGGYGAAVAAPVAGDIVVAAKQVGVIK